jgi:hypothetical protein
VTVVTAAWIGSSLLSTATVSQSAHGSNAVEMAP